ncbi:MAG TPA: hypothetical protein VKC56_08345 [Gallionellaceae bacterium]|nr:hypothetical protein [Gallionellaceae bacterium]
MIRAVLFLFAVMVGAPAFAAAISSSPGADETADEFFLQAWTVTETIPTGGDDEARDKANIRARTLVDAGLARDPSHVGLKVMSAYLRVIQQNPSCKLALNEADQIMPPAKLDEVVEAIRIGKADPRILFKAPGARKYAMQLVLLLSLVKGYCTHNLLQLKVSKTYLLLIEQQDPVSMDASLTEMLADDFISGNDYAPARQYYIKAYNLARQESAMVRTPDAKADRQEIADYALYNVAIAQYKLEDYDGMHHSLQTFWNETPRRAYWLEKMKKDEDYVPILARKDVQEIWTLR